MSSNEFDIPGYMDLNLPCGKCKHAVQNSVRVEKTPKRGMETRMESGSKEIDG